MALSRRIEQREYDKFIQGPDGYPVVSSINPFCTLEIDYSGGTNPIYVGQATPGTATSTAGWSIKKITYDANNNPTAIQWGGGLPSFAQTWDNRASLSYS